MSQDQDADKAAEPKVNPWPDGHDRTSGLYPAVIVSLARSGFEAGEIDYAVNVAAIDRMCDSDVLAVVAMLEAAKNSCTISDRLAKINVKP